MICECLREQDVLDAIAANRWPARCDEELREHVAGCAICADLIEVVRPLLDEHEQALEDVRVPPPSVVWWRAQIRARNEAARAAARPMTIAQGIAVGTVLAMAIVLVTTGWARLDGWRQALRSFSGYMATMQVSMPTFVVPTFVTQHGLLLALALGMFVIAAPLLVYVAVSDK